MLLVNGKKQHCLDISDRGFQYGDGLFETIKIQHHQPVFLQQHLSRLKNGCARLKIPFPDQQLLLDEVKQLISDNTAPLAVLKIIITRGSGGRGYRQPEVIKATRVLSMHAFPDYPLTFYEQGINSRFCDFRLGHNPELTGIKHLNRLEQVMGRSEWQESSVQEGIMLDINNNVIEGTMSNIFCVKDDVLYTPKLQLCGIEGIIRNLILENASAYHLKIGVTHLGKQDVFAAHEVFVTNSVIGLWPIRQLEHIRYSIGPVSNKVQQMLEQLQQRALSC